MKKAPPVTARPIVPSPVRVAELPCDYKRMVGIVNKPGTSFGIFLTNYLKQLDSKWMLLLIPLQG